MSNLINKQIVTTCMMCTGLLFSVQRVNATLPPGSETSNGSAINYVQEEGTVSGTVTDKKTGEPMIGVTISVKNGSEKAITDFDGNFTIKGSVGATLIFSYIGYLDHEVVVKGTAPMKVTMSEDDKVLEEVVIVGYGVQKKSSVTGAISQVKSGDIENRTMTNVEQALQGKTAGVQVITSTGRPGESSTVRIRGYSSNGSSDPLYVVDGLRTNSISNIDPNDIESMEVLKDAASAAIYGAEAGNGVVLITTKRAKSGRSIISYDFQLSSQSLSHTPKLMKAKDYIQYMTEGGFINQNQLDEYYDGKTDTDWMDLMFENSKMQRHNLSFQKAMDKASIYVSLGYLDNNGMIIGDKDKFERITGTINADAEIYKWLKVGTNNQIGRYKMSEAHEWGQYGSIIVATIMASPILTPTSKTLPSYMERFANHHLVKNANGDYINMNPYGLLVNPLSFNEVYTSKNDGFAFSGSTYLDFKPFKGFVFTSRLGYRFNFHNTYYSEAPHQTVSDSYIDYWNVQASSSNTTYYQWENFANYTTTLAEKHNLNAMLGMSFSSNRYFNTSGTAKGSNYGDLGITKNDPNYAYFAYITSGATRTVSGGEPTRTRKLSYFGRMSYDYNNTYYAQFSLRADAADLSILPLNKRWGYFPAASLGWQVSNEKFMQNQHAISHLKLRASWGQNGSVAGLGNYSYASVIGSSSFYAFDGNVNPAYTIASQPTSTGNYNLKWETSEQWDLGLDMRFLNNRLSMTADYFIKKTKDLIITGYTPSYMIGVTASPINAGNVENKGFELELSWKDNIKDFTYGISANIATLKNRVTYLTSYAGKRQGTYNSFEEGYPMWYMRGYDYVGTAPTTGYYLDGKAVSEGTTNAIMYQAGYPMYRDVDGDGFIGDNDLTYIGSGIPDFTYGVTLTASYKNFDLVVFGTGSQGNDVFYNNNVASYSIANKWQDFYDGRWTKDGDNSRYPRASMQNDDKFNHCSSFIYDGSYFKIKQIQLGYSLPKNILSKVYLTNARIYVSMDDFFTFTSYKGFDPETVAGGTEIGSDIGVFPSSKKLVFGLNVTF